MTQQGENDEDKKPTNDDKPTITAEDIQKVIDDKPIIAEDVRYLLKKHIFRKKINLKLYLLYCKSVNGCYNNIYSTKYK